MEGTLEILWENHLERAATPKYKLFFLRYRNFKSGAQRPNSIVGDDGLESYLLAIGFLPERAQARIKQVRDEKHISIDNVLMPDEFVAAYAN